MGAPLLLLQFSIFLFLGVSLALQAQELPQTSPLSPSISATGNNITPIDLLNSSSPDTVQPSSSSSNSQTTSTSLPAKPTELAPVINQQDPSSLLPHSTPDVIVFDVTSSTSAPIQISNKLRTTDSPSSSVDHQPSNTNALIAISAPANISFNPDNLDNVSIPNQPTSSQPNLAITTLSNATSFVPNGRASRVISNSNETFQSPRQFEPTARPVVSSTTTLSPFELISTTRSLTNSAGPTSAPASEPNSRPTVRPPELRLPQNNRNTNSVTLQLLKPKSKVRCINDSDCNHGLCSKTGSCFCEPGFTGEDCAIDIDECRQVQEPCLNNGTCVNAQGHYRCECEPGFRGDICQDSVDMCEKDTCLNGGKCINHRTFFTCECKPGWEGSLCQTNTDECQQNPCQNNATCHDMINDYVCDCGQSGFVGKNCEINFDECAQKPCGIGAKECIDLVGDYKCLCHDGFEGKKCDVDIDECRTNPCENNGTCVQNSIHMIRLLNNSSILADHSTSYHDIRDHNLPSANTNLSQLAGFICECKEEFHGERCEERKKCYTKSIQELCNNQQAECVNVGSSYDCLINASFDGSGRNYATYKVESEFKMREIYVKYRSLTGGVIMTFETTQPDSPLADLQLNKSGLYLSGTPIKRDENIKFDELLDGNEREIRLGLDTPTEIKSITLTRQNDIMSESNHLSFKGCLMQVRLNNHLIPFIEYGFNMSKPFKLSENNLELGHCRTCFDRDCLNDGHCESQDGYDRCTCPDTFTGNFCEVDVNECDKSVGSCLNGGTCENLHGGYRCNCAEGFRGEKCQEISDYCKAKQPCVIGTCKNVNSAQLPYHCDCPSTHIGKRCERKRDCVNECHIQQSQCINNVTCACLPGRRDERIMCEFIARCEQIEGELCRNGGVCKNKDSGGYYCDCQEPFHGPICQYMIEKPQVELYMVVILMFVGFLVATCAVVALVCFRSIRKARATCGTYSPSNQEKFGNSACDLLKPPQLERLI